MVIPKDQEQKENPYPKIRQGLMANPQKTEEWNDMLAKLKQKKEARELDEARMLKKKQRIDAKKFGKKLVDIKEEEESSEPDKQSDKLSDIYRKWRSKIENFRKEWEIWTAYLNE